MAEKFPWVRPWLAAEENKFKREIEHTEAFQSRSKLPKSSAATVRKSNGIFLEPEEGAWQQDRLGYSPITPKQETGLRR
jgi:hypothetical protein